MEIQEQDVINYIISRGIPKQLICYAKPVPSKRLGNDVFRTIVEMSYEMWRSDRIQRHKDEIDQVARLIKRMIHNIPRDMKTGRLRTTKVWRSIKPLTQLCQYNGQETELVLKPVYHRYRSEEWGRIIETIRIERIEFGGKVTHWYGLSLLSSDTNESVEERLTEIIPDNMYNLCRFWMNPLPDTDENGIEYCIVTSSISGQNWEWK
jgi:hypothetical protein